MNHYQAQQIISHSLYRQVVIKLHFSHLILSILLELSPVTITNQLINIENYRF